MNIITEKEINGRLVDGIDTLLTLPEEDFQKAISLLQISKSKNPENIRFFYSTDKCEAPDQYITLGLEDPRNRRCYLGTVPTMSEIFKELSLRATSNDEKSVEHSRIMAILETRNVQALKKEYLNINSDNMELLNKLFEVLEDSSTLEKFLDFNNNSEYFALGKTQATIQDYFQLLGNIFGNMDENGNLKGRNYIEENFYIPNLDSIIQSVKTIYQRYNIDRYIDPEYEFKTIKFNEEIFRNGDEPQWDINPSLRNAIYKDMPDNLSLEEKALYIYTKLCSILEYNEEFLYRNKGITPLFGSHFSKQHLEEIVPGSKIICYEFSRICAKLINEIDGDIEAVVISQGTNPGHFLTGFYTDKVSVRLEAINININGENNPTNDLTKAKNGTRLHGIIVHSDKEGIVQNAMAKVYQFIYGNPALSTNKLVQEFKNMPETAVPDDMKLKLQSFIEVMKSKGIVGNEFVQTLEELYKAKFFGYTAEKTFLGKRTEHDGEKHIQRMVLFRQKGLHENEETRFYLINTATLKMIEPTAQELIDALNSDTIIYESEKHKLEGLDKGGK